MGISARRALTGAVAASLLCLTAVDTARAEPVPADSTAVPAEWYSIRSEKAVHVPFRWDGTTYKDGPGGTVTVVVPRGGTISARVTGTGEFEAGGIVAKAEADVSVKIGGRVTVAPGHSYSRTIARGKYGHLQFGSWGYEVTWKKYRSGGGNCGGVEIGHGSATLPTSETGWKYWETSS
ncbi:hypothetical protein ACFWN1_08090 [Streptomyces sp. NPDC058459]|uniref:hypothetical protein n=1 Tax=Streptomyces sp. NPDC058459 TaxID=3346508 RepID=UPI003657F10E